MSDVTLLLGAAAAGDRKAAADLLPLVYDELRKLAAARMADEAPYQTLQPTALVHEAYLRLIGPTDEARLPPLDVRPGLAPRRHFRGRVSLTNFFPDSVRQTESFLALMGEPQPGGTMLNDPNRVKEIFLGATEQPDDAARAAYLDRACGDDAGLRDRVEALLRSHDPAGSFLGNPAVKPPELDKGATQELGSAAPPEDANQTDDDLTFLDKPRRPDSLGRIGHYDMLQVLGRGGFGIVFRAFDDTLQRVVAVKVMAPQIATLSPARKRFLREARSSAAVRHENVVHVYEVGEQPLPYLVMEFVPGETLQQKLNRCGPLDVPEVLRIGRQIAEGLAAAHASDLIHRDIKPGNVLLEGGSHKAKITDFGLARAADDASISQSGVIAGTPMFMAPEQALGHHIDQRADLFSLGSVLYQMASGRPPFRAPSALAVLKRVAEETPRPIPEIIPETPEWLCGIIAKLHAKNPEDRFQSAREVADLLADCEAKLKAKQEVRNILPVAVKPARRKWVAAAILLLPVIALAVTEFAGVTHLFRGQQATHDPIKPDGDPTPVVVAKQEPPLAVAPFDAAQATKHQEAWAKHLGVPVELTNAIGMKLRLIPPGQFHMGSSQDEIESRLAEADDFHHENLRSEAPRRLVEIPAPFYLGHFEVTVAQFRKFVEETGYKTTAETNGKGGGRGDDKREYRPEWTWRHPDHALSDDHPAVEIDLRDAKEFCAWLSKKDGRAYVVPDEKHWEFACRAGTTSPWYGQREALSDFAWVASNSGGKTHAVGGKLPNAFGLFDMLGNVEELCLAHDGGVVGRGGMAHHLFICARCPARRRAAEDDTNFRRGLRVAIVGDLKAKPPALAVAPFDAAQAKEHQETWAKHLGVPVEFKNSIGMKLRLIPPGRFLMGSTQEEVDELLRQLRERDPQVRNEQQMRDIRTEAPQRSVEIPEPFYMGQYEVTVGQFRKFVEETKYKTSAERDGRGEGAYRKVGPEWTWRQADATLSDDHPLVQISLEDADQFCTWLSKKDGRAYAVPDEQRWEFACRAGTTASRYGDDLQALSNFAWIAINSGGTTHAVGEKMPNAFGLFDMLGNVEELCRTLGGGVVGRGGMWHLNDFGTRCAVRTQFAEDVSFFRRGFRVAIVGDLKSPVAKQEPLPPTENGPGVSHR